MGNFYIAPSPLKPGFTVGNQVSPVFLLLEGRYSSVSQESPKVISTLFQAPIQPTPLPLKYLSKPPVTTLGPASWVALARNAASTDGNGYTPKYATHQAARQLRQCV